MNTSSDRSAGTRVDAAPRYGMGQGPGGKGAAAYWVYSVRCCRIMMGAGSACVPRKVAIVPGGAAAQAGTAWGVIELAASHVVAGTVLGWRAWA